MDKIKSVLNDIFVCCCGNEKTTPLSSILKLFWPILNNSLTLTELCGMHLAHNTDTYDSQLFELYIRKLASIKYPVSKDSLRRFLDEFKTGRSLISLTETTIFSFINDKDVITSFIEFDPIWRHMFSAYCYKDSKAIEAIGWNEVKQQSLGLSMQQFISLAESHGMSPLILSRSECEDKFMEIFTLFPLLPPSDSFGTALLFPQFQLLLLNLLRS